VRQVKSEIDFLCAEIIGTKHLYDAHVVNSIIDEMAEGAYVVRASRPDGRRIHSGGKSGLHGDTVPDNFRRGQPQGKRHRKETAARQG
jgi:hypothetical protein